MKLNVVTIPAIIVAASSVSRPIRQVLRTQTGFEIQEFRSELDALTATRRWPVQLAILDASCPNLATDELATSLRSWYPDIRIFLIQQPDPTRRKSLHGFEPDGLILDPGDPHALNVLLDVHFSAQPAGELAGLEPEMLSPESAPAAPEPSENLSTAPFPWLADVDRAVPLLAKQQRESGAEGLLITRAGQVWAYAGSYPQLLVEELAGAVSHYWQVGVDLARFVRLEASGDEVMLYATQLVGDMVLALVFPARTQFSRIRKQTAAAVRSLLDVPLGNFAQAAPAPAIGSGTGPSTWVRTSTAPFVVEPWPELGDTGAALNLDIGESGARPSAPVLSESSIARISMPGLPRAPLPYDLPLETEESLSTQLAVSAVERLPFSDWTVQDTHLEPATASVYKLTYACVILPRLPHHLLTQDLARMLNDWVPQICVAFGWRVEHVAIRPEFAQFMIDVPPETSPQSLMQVIQRVTSQRIFSAYPKFQQENPSGDFWAPSHMIIGSSDLPPKLMVQDFITQTRARQGLA